MAIDSWNVIGEPELAKALEKYAKGAFPGGLFDCSLTVEAHRARSRCLLLEPGDLPPDGMLMFFPTSWDRPNAVRVVHYEFVSVEEETARRRDRGDSESEIRRFQGHHPSGWLLEETLYSVDIARLENGGWKVGNARYECCV